MKELSLNRVDLSLDSLELLTREQLYEYISLLKNQLNQLQAHHDQKMSDWGWERSAEHARVTGGWQ